MKRYEIRQADGGWQLWLEEEQLKYTGILIQAEDEDAADFIAARIMDGLGGW